MTTRDPAAPAVDGLLSRRDKHLDRQGNAPELRGKHRPGASAEGTPGRKCPEHRRDPFCRPLGSELRCPWSTGWAVRRTLPTDACERPTDRADRARAGVRSGVGEHKGDDVRKPRSIESAGAFGLLGRARPRGECQDNGGIVLNTPHGVSAPAPLMLCVPVMPPI